MLMAMPWYSYLSPTASLSRRESKRAFAFAVAALNSGSVTVSYESLYVHNDIST
jgi:hypothetical protein